MTLENIHVACVDDRVYVGTLDADGQFVAKEDRTGEVITAVRKWLAPDEYQPGRGYQRIIASTGGRRRFTLTLRYED